MNGRLIAAAVALAIAGPSVAVAHHSYAMFDHSKEIVLKGAVVKDWQWTSPHTWLYLLVPNGTKDPDKYSIEGGNPGALRRLGFGKGTMAPGDKVTVYMAPLKNGEKGGALNAVMLANGKLLGERNAIIK
jgi:hypothetical protein